MPGSKLTAIFMLKPKASVPCTNSPPSATLRRWNYLGGRMLATSNGFE
jgi:hypothetical protein